MIFDYKSFYISSQDHGRLLRYDVIKLDYESYLVKVFDEKHDITSSPRSVVQTDEFLLARSDFLHTFEKDGFALAVKYNRPHF